jgi:hypothetical protein
VDENYNWDEHVIWSAQTGDCGTALQSHAWKGRVAFNSNLIFL